jgi:hypothetical protein
MSKLRLFLIALTLFVGVLVFFGIKSDKTVFKCTGITQQKHYRLEMGKEIAPNMFEMDKIFIDENYEQTEEELYIIFNKNGFLHNVFGENNSNIVLDSYAFSNKMYNNIVHADERSLILVISNGFDESELSEFKKTVDTGLFFKNPHRKIKPLMQFNTVSGEMTYSANIESDIDYSIEGEFSGVCTEK